MASRPRPRSIRSVVSTVTAAALATVRSLTLSVLIVLAGCLGTGVASAQIGVGIDNPVAGGTALLTFEIPGIRALTTQVTVRLPHVQSARCLVPAWNCRVHGDIATGVVRAVTWSAAPGAGIEPGQSARFPVLLAPPDAMRVGFPVIQTLSDNTLIRWDQPPLPGAKLPNPEPAMTLMRRPGERPVQTDPGSAPASPPATATPNVVHVRPDELARQLLRAAIVACAVAVGLVLTRTPRS
jgi:uncharacterized protein YcnI